MIKMKKPRHPVGVPSYSAYVANSCQLPLPAFLFFFNETSCLSMFHIL